MATLRNEAEVDLPGGSIEGDLDVVELLDQEEMDDAFGETIAPQVVTLLAGGDGGVLGANLLGFDDAKGGVDFLEVAVRLG